MVNSYEKKSIEKYYTIAKVLLTISPIVCVLYLNVGSISVGKSILNVIQEDPKLLIMFLSTMSNPFIAYLLIFMQRRIEEKDIAYAVVNLAILVIAQIMFQNIVFIAVLGLLLYKMLKTYNVSLKECFREKFKNQFILTISGAIVVIFIASICLFASIRISI